MNLLTILSLIDSHDHTPLSLVDKEGRIAWCNAYFQDRFGRPGVSASRSLRDFLRTPIGHPSVVETLRSGSAVAIDTNGAQLPVRPLLEHDDHLLLTFVVAAPAAASQQELAPDHFRRSANERPGGSRPDVVTLENAQEPTQGDYERLANSVSMLVVRFDRERRRIYVNSVYEVFHGIAASACLGKTVKELPSCDPEHTVDIDNTLAQVIATGRSLDIERDYVDRQGRHICSTERYVPEYDATNAICGVLLIGFSRYDEHAARKALLDAAIQLREIYDNVGEAVSLSEADATGSYRICSVNRSYEQLAGVQGHTFVDQLTRDVPFASFGKMLDQLRDKCLANCSPQVRTFVATLDSQKRVLEARFYPSAERLPGQRRVVEVYRDITDDHTLRWRLRSLLESFPDLVFGLSEDGLITFVTPSVVACLGGSPESYLGHSVLDALAEVSGDAALVLRDAFDRTRRGQRSVVFETFLTTKTGRREFEFRVFGRKAATGGISHDLLVILRDVGVLRRTEKALLAANRKLEQHRLATELSIEDERKRIAHDLHDELGQELTAMRYALLHLSNMLEAGESGIDKRIEAIDTMIDRSLQSVRRIVRKLRPPALDLGLVPAVQGLIEQLFGQTEIDCDLAVVPRFLQLGDFHSLHAFRCIQEALTNILRHSRATLAYVCIDQRADEVVVRIGDNGRGFHQSLSRNRNGIRGMRERAELLAGRVSIRSSIGMGTEITLSFRTTTQSEGVKP